MHRIDREESSLTQIGHMKSPYGKVFQQSLNMELQKYMKYSNKQNKKTLGERSKFQRKQFTIV